MIVNTQHSNMLISPARTVVGKVELYKGSTLSQTFSHTDALSSFVVSRTGDKKFFGYGIGQELELKLVDKDRAINVVENDILKVSFRVEEDAVYPTPLFYVSADIKRDENTNGLTIKAYDAVYKSKSHQVRELPLTAPYTIGDVAAAIAELLGLTGVRRINVTDTSFDTSYDQGANFDGAETLREVLDAIAGATQTIYYIDAENYLVFKRLNKAGDPVLTINKADYFTLKSGSKRTLSDICSATELGDNVIIGSGEGEIQYVRDNPFWELRDDISLLLDAAITVAGGLSITEFNCKWRGNYLLEPGDKIKLITKDNDTVTSYLLNEKYTYNGGFVAETVWEYADNEESADNPVTLGDALKKTYAKVDKANQQIDIVAGETAAIKLTNDAIQTSVSQLDNNMSEVLSEVNTKVSADDVTISIQKAMEQGVTAVTTTTGFTFNEEGMHISKTGSEITTTITEDGMTVLRENDEVLVADNLGVRAEDLHATTFLIIGKNSRFEDYGNRTGCFWIG